MPADIEKTGTKILIADDDKELQEVVEYHLQKEGYQVFKASDGKEALKNLKVVQPDLLVLDLIMPGLTGLEVCHELRKQGNLLPILMLTAKASELDKVRGLETGADDYLTKPFSSLELIARIKALLRRLSQRNNTETPKDEILKYQEVNINLTRHEVTIAGKAVDLTAKEFSLLVYFVRYRGVLLSREKLLSSVWEIEADIETRTVDVHVKRLREKLSIASKYLQTIKGFGYKFL
jgi:DNA-binding response OmpR family regulator